MRLIRCRRFPKSRSQYPLIILGPEIFIVTSPLVVPVVIGVAGSLIRFMPIQITLQYETKQDERTNDYGIFSRTHTRQPNHRKTMSTNAEQKRRRR